MKKTEDLRKDFEWSGWNILQLFLAKTLDKNVWRIRKIYSTKSPSLLFTVVNPQMNQSHSLAHLIKLRSSHYLWSSFWIFVTKDVDKIISSAVPPLTLFFTARPILARHNRKFTSRKSSVKRTWVTEGVLWSRSCVFKKPVSALTYAHRF